jgi:hypothetical protein
VQKFTQGEAIAPHLVCCDVQALTRELLVTTRSENNIVSAMLGAFITAAALGVPPAVARCALSAKPTVKFAAESLKVAVKVLFVNVH